MPVLSYGPKVHLYLAQIKVSRLEVDYMLKDMNVMHLCRMCDIAKQRYSNKNKFQQNEDVWFEYENYA